MILADQVRALVAIEQRAQHLDLEVRARAVLAELPVHRGDHAVDVARQVGEPRFSWKFSTNAHEGLVQGGRARVVGAVVGSEAGSSFSMYSGRDAGARR